MCTKLCLQEYIKNYCDCIDGSLPNIYSTSNVIICATLNLLNCTSNARSQYYNDIEASSCQQCPKECDYIGKYVENLLTGFDYYGTRLPRLPMQIERDIKLK